MSAVLLLFAVLCLVPVSRSSPLLCEVLVQPFHHIDPDTLVGRWALIGGSARHLAVLEGLRKLDSANIDYYKNSSYIHANRVADKCVYVQQNITLEGPNLTFKMGHFNFSVTFLHTSCPDCVLLTLEISHHGFRSHELYLFSRRRQLKDWEMQEFRHQVECQKLPPPVLMDPAKQLCGEEAPIQQVFIQ